MEANNLQNYVKNKTCFLWLIFAKNLKKSRKPTQITRIYNQCIGKVWFGWVGLMAYLNL